ncbi:MAG TPA: TonB system transport protein TonB, partial [Thermoanaerobaculia bacterium]|nr:TonB system transport protein TonB [Thermoanaerobaculia bacterium]
MLSSLLLASVLIVAQPPMACAGATAIAPAAQPPHPEPGEPIEPPVLEEPPVPEDPPMPEDPGIPTPDPTEPCCFTN